MLKTLYPFILILSFVASSVTIGLGFYNVISMIEYKMIKLILALTSIFLSFYWPYCITMKTSDILDKKIEKDTNYRKWKNENKGK